MKKTKLKSASDFWLKMDQYENKEKSAFNTRSTDIIQLAASQRAISNFVRIVTGQAIPVKFTMSKNSYTDGKSVVISSNVDEVNFDPTVGLALHEASHVKLTDFTAATGTNVYRKIASNHPVLFEHINKKYTVPGSGFQDSEAFNLIFTLTNYVEDRRIDNFIYTTAPGYRAYYHSLYDTYFNSKIIDKGVRSKSKRSEDWDSYMFRIINLTNINRDLTALKGLEEIWNILDLANISRLESTSDSLDVAIKLFEAGEKHIAAAEKDQPENDPENNNTESGDDQGEEDGEGEGNDAKVPQANNGKSKSKKQKSQEPEELSQKDLNSLDKSIKSQGDFLSGKVAKKRVNGSELSKIESISASEIEMKNCNTPVGVIPCMVIKKFNKQLVDADVFRFLITDRHYKTHVANNQKTIMDGIRLGTMLGKKLKIRSESRDTIFNRQKHGNIDKRMLSSLGAGLENIFTRTETMSYNPGIVHISLDISSSMQGRKFEKAMLSIVAIAKACDMIDNMDCVISFRGTHENPDPVPVMLMGYDSRVDSFVKIASLFKYVRPSGYTPEGICFQSVLNSILTAAAGKDAYFINFSDGEPCFTYGKGSDRLRDYVGKDAAMHTANQIKKMTSAGIKVLSYFIGGGYHWNDENSSMKLFKQMYGNDAEFVDVNNLTELTRTLNTNFLKK